MDEILGTAETHQKELKGYWAHCPPHPTTFNPLHGSDKWLVSRYLNIDINGGMQNLLSTERVKELGNSRRHDSMKMVSEYRLGWNELQ